MSKPDIDLPTDWRTKAVNRITAKVPDAGHCPACDDGMATVSPSDHLVTPVVYDAEGNMIVGGPAYPQIMLVCNNCGYTRYFNYLILAGDDEDGD